MRKLIDLYYTMWVDTIIKFKSVPINKDDWKYKSILYISMAMALQWAFLIALFERHITHTHYYKLDIDIFPGDNIDAFITFFILYLLPFLIINYLLIFLRDRYKVLINTYEYKNGKYFLIYTIGTFISFALLMLAGLIWKIVTE